MKNIHIIPTDKPSRLHNKNGDLGMRTAKLYIEDFIGNKHNSFHIYITSNEEIKEGDWVYFPISNEVLKTGNGFYEASLETVKTNEDCKKITLTTDQDLIADGVQTIDDTFLEWFVKNPSCKSVEIINRYSDFTRTKFLDYKIIIPQEEPKQIYYNTVGREDGKFVIKGQFNTQKEALDLANKLNRKYPDLYYDWNETLVKEEPKQKKWDTLNKELDDALEEEFGSEEPKQETLEEAYLNELIDEANKEFTLDRKLAKKVAIKYAKWQQERMYSEEEVIKIVEKSRETGLTAEFLLLTEQFKKKD